MFDLGSQPHPPEPTKPFAFHLHHHRLTRETEPPVLGFKLYEVRLDRVPGPRSAGRFVELECGASTICQWRSAAPGGSMAAILISASTSGLLCQ